MRRSTTARLRRTSISPSSAAWARGSVSRSWLGIRSARLSCPARAKLLAALGSRLRRQRVGRHQGGVGRIGLRQQVQRLLAAGPGSARRARGSAAAAPVRWHRPSLAPACRRRRTAHRLRRSGPRSESCSASDISAVAVFGLSLPSAFCCRARAARKALSAAAGLSARLARVPAAISVSNWPISPELNALAASRLASSASAPDVGSAASARVDAGQHADRALHHLRRRQHAVGVPDRAVHQRHHRDMRPAAEPLRALHQLGRTAAKYRGGGWRLAAVPGVDAGAPLAGGGELGKLGGAARSAGADTRARLLPCAAEHIGALAAPCVVSACCVQSSPTEFLPIDTCAAGLTAPPCAPRTYASGGGVAHPNSSSAASSAIARRAVARMVSSPDRRRWAAAGRPPRLGWTVCRSRCRSAGLPPVRPPRPAGSSSPS